MFIVYYFSKMHLTWFFYISGILCSLYLCLEVLFSERKVIQKSNKTNYCWEILQEAFVNRKFRKCQNSQTFLHKSPQKSLLNCCEQNATVSWYYNSEHVINWLFPAVVSWGKGGQFDALPLKMWVGKYLQGPNRGRKSLILAWELQWKNL